MKCTTDRYDYLKKICIKWIAFRRNDVLSPLIVVANKINGYALRGIKSNWFAIDSFSYQGCFDLIGHELRLDILQIISL